ncbi:MAG: adenosylmethionine--8-amino-7-oxononanoate transaminase [Flavobacteriales bacterium]|nr:adenosylmethionine--8-amino-7-oxononanoate transaminase [Flavobacteriales bacterium]
MKSDWTELLQFDKKHIWHPYTSVENALPVYPVEKAEGVYLELGDGTKLVDGMSSWWTAIHGYNHPTINAALIDQISKVSHVMFGGITHRPAIQLAQLLIELTPPSLEKVFFSDSGSVAVEVAIKMALQYWQSKGKNKKNRLMTTRSGYHGDTFKAMSVCDPVNGMHHLFSEVLSKTIFADKPTCKWNEEWDTEAILSLQKLFEEQHENLAAFIIEPIVQGAGGMNFYHPQYLTEIRTLCDKYEVLLIADEIATGFGRTGKLFACEHSAISPDIICVGKALTGGYLSLAATLTTKEVSSTISKGESGVLMHGPTFMGNPLACSAGVASLNLLLQSNWKEKVSWIEKKLTEGLAAIQEHQKVKELRICGAIAVIETYENIDVAAAQIEFKTLGVWIRPFRNLIYIMPPFIIEKDELELLILAMKKIITKSIYIQ